MVRDLGVSLRFYRALGFQVIGRTGNDRCEVRALHFGNTAIKLLRWNQPPAEAAPATLNAIGFRYLTLHVADVRAALTQCETLRAPVVVPVSRHSERCEFAMVADPDGNVVELSQGVPWETVGPDAS